MLRNVTLVFGAIAAASLLPSAAHSDTLVRVTGQVRDSVSDAAIASRLYIRGEDGTWYFPNSTDLRDVVRYKRKNYWDENQVEMHATLSAKPFEVELPAGEYTVIVERGKEYLPLKTKLAVDESHAQWQLRPTRWIDMAARGWYSGDLHCHRPPEELANLMIAEDLNVCFPMTYWTTIAEVPPDRGDKTSQTTLPASPVRVDATHVWCPRNTEYEIFKVGGKKHTLGAVSDSQSPHTLQAALPSTGSHCETGARRGRSH